MQVFNPGKDQISTSIRLPDKSNRRLRIIFSFANEIIPSEYNFRDACSWKGQLERTRSWKVSLKLERAKRNWKEPIEVRKNRAKLERTERSWKASFQVGKSRCKWKVLAEVGKFE